MEIGVKGTWNINDYRFFTGFLCSYQLKVSAKLLGFANLGKVVKKTGTKEDSIIMI